MSIPSPPFKDSSFSSEKTTSSWLSFSDGDNRVSSSQKFDFRKTVMICDDESDVLMAYKIALASKYSVVTAGSGRECLSKYNDEKLLGRKVDVLLLDYKLGDIPGDEVACKIKDMDGTKVILISAYEIDPSFLKDLEERNCISSFVRKPVTMASLMSTVDRVLLS